MNNETSLAGIVRFMSKCKQEDGKILFKGHWHKIRHGDRVEYIISKGLQIPVKFIE